MKRDKTGRKNKMRNPGDLKRLNPFNDMGDVMEKYMPTAVLFLLFLLLLAVTAGCASQDTVTFKAEITEVSDNRIEVDTVDFEEFDKASVALGEAEYDFKPEAGQLVEITIRPEIRESYPVQVTAVKLVLIGEAEKRVEDYFPIRENVKYVYEGKGNEYASYQVHVDYASENRVQQRIDNGGTVAAHVYEVKDGKVTLLQAKGEVYHRENMLEREGDLSEVILMEPLEKGTTWTLSDGRERAVTGTAEEVRTPLGTFSCIEVITEAKDSITIDYYARDVGLVKTIFRSGGMEVSSTLESIEKDVARTEKIRFYYPDIEQGKIKSKEKEVAWRTNDDTAEILEIAYAEAVGEYFGSSLSTGKVIKSLSLDEENRVRLDFSASFTEAMNAGIAYETMILQSIANTFGNYYNSEEVILTVEGKPYESGHILMKEGESIHVELEEAEADI